jgi:hypothetical protein
MSGFGISQSVFERPQWVDSGQTVDFIAMAALALCALRSGQAALGQTKPQDEWLVLGSATRKRTDRSPPIAATRRRSGERPELTHCRHSQRRGGQAAPHFPRSECGSQG